MIPLRNYQLDSVERVRQAIRAGRRSILLVAPCGSGKTVVASHILRSAHDKGRPTLFMAHRRELIKQASNKLSAFDVPHGIMMAGESPSALAETQIASIQSFMSRVVKRKNTPSPSADVVILDEAHRATSNSYLHLKSLYPEAIFIGLTATPCRSDGRGLGRIFDEIIEVSTPQELIDMGFLVDTKIVAPRLPDLRGVKVVRGEYDDDELEERMNPLVGDIVQDWQNYANNRPTIAFAVTVRHSLWIQRKFEDAGIRCEHVDALTPIKRRDRIFKEFIAGEIPVLTNVGICTEGTDLPIAAVAIMARPTKSYGLYLQCVGRIARPYPGKDSALIIDHSGSVYQHGFPQDACGWELDSKFSMTEKNQERLKKESQPITCRECFTVYSKQLHCPNCGALPSKQGQQISTEEGRLYEIPRKKKKKPQAFTMKQKREFFGQLKHYAKEKGYAKGWASHKFRERIGVWPNAVSDAMLIPPTLETLSWIKSRQIRWANSGSNLNGIKNRDGWQKIRKANSSV